METFKKLKTDELSLPLNNKSAYLLEQLYDKTFYDSSSAYSASSKKERVTVFDLDLLSLLQFGAKYP